MKRRRAFWTGLAAVSVILALPVSLTVRDVWRQQRNHALLLAIQRQDVEGIRSLLKQGADPNTRYTEELDKPLWNILLDCLHGKHAPLATGPSALLCALQSNPSPGQPESPQALAIGKILLEHGASPNADADEKDKDINSLSLAITMRKPQFARLLLTHKVDRTFINHEQYSLMDGYAYQGDVEMMQMLLDAGADINHKYLTVKLTPLMTAAMGGNAKSVRFLLAHHADPALKCDWGQTALQIARQSKHSNPQIMALLREAERNSKETHAR